MKLQQQIEQIVFHSHYSSRTRTRIIIIMNSLIGKEIDTRRIHMVIDTLKRKDITRILGQYVVLTVILTYVMKERM